MKKIIIVIITCIAALLTTLVQPKNINAETVFEYTDKNGDLFITDDIEKMPKSYREEAKNRTNVVIKNKLLLFYIFN